MKYVSTVLFFISILVISCRSTKELSFSESSVPFTWENASIYFLLTDRFNNGDSGNDFQHDIDNPPAPYRGFMGGDIKGITDKINEGYFSELGVNALWMTPVVEQIEGSVDEGTGTSFAFHGYWTKDWTAIDPRFGTKDDLKEMIEAAHKKGIRVLIDVVANHTGPVTSNDEKWPDSWVKTSPQCTYQDFETTVNCTLVKNLPDIKTESQEEVTLPPFLVEKWKQEGRYETEISELNLWFEQTGYPRTPAYHILKWLVDFVAEYGIDGYRVDTVKHTEGYLWKALYESASIAFENWKKGHPQSNLDDVPFYMVGEVYNYYAGAGRDFDYGDTIVDFFDEGFDALINFDFKSEAHKDYESIFSKYNKLLHGPLTGKTTVHYISSHDDSGPFDKAREQPIVSGTKLLLCPGGVQIYYGDETARSLSVEAMGDATLRSFMNWDEIQNNENKNGGFNVKEILNHWKKLGKFRNAHPSVGAGRHTKISDLPYTFSRKWKNKGYEDKVVVSLDTNKGRKTISVKDVFLNGEKLKDYYSGTIVVVRDGSVVIDSPYNIVLLAPM